MNCTMNFLPQNVRTLILREDLVTLTKSTKKAIVLGLFFDWSAQLDQFIAEETARQNKESVTVNSSPAFGWLNIKMDDFIKDAMLYMSVYGTRCLLQTLIDAGYLYTRKYTRKIRQYRLNLVQIYNDLQNLGYSPCDLAQLLYGEEGGRGE